MRCDVNISLRRPEYATFLGLHDGQAYFSIAREAVTLGRPSHDINIRVAAETWGALHAAVFAQAKALHYWQSQSKFCGRCGSLMDLKTAGYNASCGACGLITYPQTHPAVIMCVSDGEGILLGRQAVCIGEVAEAPAGLVTLRSSIGGTRIVDLLSGEQLPRIC